MIARSWHGVTKAAQAEQYLKYLHATGLDDIGKTEGNRGVMVLRRIDGDRAHFQLISFWNSYEAIRRFAGDEIERAFYYPEDKDFLLELEPEVAHYEVVYRSGDVIPGG